VIAQKMPGRSDCSVASPPEVRLQLLVHYAYRQLHSPFSVGCVRRGVDPGDHRPTVRERLRRRSIPGNSESVNRRYGGSPVTRETGTTSP
jgi:hypothetical protein